MTAPNAAPPAPVPHPNPCPEPANALAGDSVQARGMYIHPDHPALALADALRVALREAKTQLAHCKDALLEIDLRTTQATIASAITPKAKREGFLLSELGRIKKEARKALAALERTGGEACQKTP